MVTDNIQDGEKKKKKNRCQWYQGNNDDGWEDFKIGWEIGGGE